MSEKQSQIFRWILVLLAVAVVLFALLQLVTVSTFNNTPRQAARDGAGETVTVYTEARGGETSSWIKQNAHMMGAIYDTTFTNRSSMDISDWTLRINIHSPCYLNQFWNGEVEVHQGTGDGTEAVQRMNLAHVRPEEVTLDYRVDQGDLLIPLDEGDSIIYYPSATAGEIPLDYGQETVVGVIFYTTQGLSMDLSDYELTYYFHRTVSQGPLFVALCVVGIVFLLACAFYTSSLLAYRRARRELDQRVEGISCMTELYSRIYIIDIESNQMKLVGDKTREKKKKDQKGKEISVHEQLRTLIREDAAENERDRMEVFVDLNTLPRRLADRRHIAVEYFSDKSGWVRISFIAMDSDPGEPPARILFTLQEINDEHQEMESILQQVESARTQRGESREFMESVSAQIQTPLRAMLGRNETILEKSRSEEVRAAATEIRQTGEMVLNLVDSTLDYMRLNAGQIRLSEREYAFQSILERVDKSMRIVVQEKDVAFKYEISPSVPPLLLGDGGKMRQILLNLLGRAMSTLESGTITLRIFGKSSGENRIHLLVSVLDEGKRNDMEEGGLNMSVVRGLLGLMNATLKEARLGDVRDTYFEVDQTVPKAADPAEEPETEARQSGDGDGASEETDRESEK